MELWFITKVMILLNHYEIRIISIDSLIQDLMRKFHDKKLGLTNNIKRGDFVSFCTFLYFWSSISIGL